MTITFIGSGRADEGSGQAASVTANLPTGVKDGDLLVALACTKYANGAVTQPDWSEPVAGSLLDNVRTQLFTRRANNEPASYTFTAPATAHWGITVAAFRGVGAFDTGELTTDGETAASLTLADDDSLLLWCIQNSGDPYQSIGVPTGFTSIPTRPARNSSKAAMGWQVWPSAGATGGQTGVSSTSANTVGMFAWRPASTNTAPVANDSSVSVGENQTYTGTLSATDADNDGLTYRIVSPPANGAVTVTDSSTGAFTYTPDNDWSGSDSFAFKANDGTADSNIASVSLTVIGAVSAAGGLTAPPPALAAEATYTPPRLHASATLTFSAAALSGAAPYHPPTVHAALTLGAAAPRLTGAGAYGQTGLDIRAALTLAPPALQASGHYTPPAVEASGRFELGPARLTTAGDYHPAAIHATAGLGGATPTLEASLTYHPAGIAAGATLQAGSPTLAAAIHYRGPLIAEGKFLLAPATLTARAAYTPPGIAAQAGLTLAAPRLHIDATFGRVPAIVRRYHLKARFASRQTLDATAHPRHPVTARFKARHAVTARIAPPGARPC